MSKFILIDSYWLIVEIKLFFIIITSKIDQYDPLQQFTLQRNKEDLFIVVLHVRIYKNSYADILKSSVTPMGILCWIMTK